MSFKYCFTFTAVEMSVRYGDCDCNTHNDDIIACYVHLGLERAKQLTHLAAVRQAHMRVVNTLIDTMCDHCIASFWRKKCYRYIKRLLPLLYEISDQQQYKQKTQEINKLHAYYIGDKQNNYPLQNSQP